MIIRNRCKETFYKIYAKYKDDMWIHKGPNEDGFYSRILAREVAVTREACDDPDDYDVFAFLHEVGHVLTNKPYQKRCLQEYLASQWALEEAKNFQFYVSEDIIDLYQRYIWQWRETCIKQRGKDVPTKEELTLRRV